MTEQFPSQAGPDQASDDVRSPWPGLLGLMLVATVFRCVALNQQLWYDEMATLLNSVRQPLGTILTTYTSQNQHLLYSVMARLAMDAFGDHIWTLRLPAVIFGVASVPALYFCARLWTQPREAWFASALLTASYHHVWFSQNARGYTGMAFWTILATYYFVCALREESAKPWFAYGFCMALGIYTHLTMGFVTAGHFAVYLWILAQEKLPGWLKPLAEKQAVPARRFLPLVGFVAAGLLSVLLYGPILPSILHKTVGGGVKTSVGSDWTNPLWTVLETLKGLAAGAAGGALGLVIVLVAGVILMAGVVSYWKQNRIAVALITVPGILTAVVMLMMEHNLWPRFFFFAIGFGFLFLMRGAVLTGEWVAQYAGQKNQRAWGTALGILIILGSAWSVKSAWIYPKQDFVGAMQFVDAQRRPDEPVLLAGLGVFPYKEYFRRDWIEVSTRTELSAVRAAGKPVWLLTTFPVYLKSRHPDVWETLEQEFTQVKVFRGTIGDGEVRVYRWQPPPGN